MSDYGIETELKEVLPAPYHGIAHLPPELIMDAYIDRLIEELESTERWISLHETEADAADELIESVIWQASEEYPWL